MSYFNYFQQTFSGQTIEKASNKFIINDNKINLISFLYDQYDDVI